MKIARCRVDGCRRRPFLLDMCPAHYGQWADHQLWVDGPLRLPGERVAHVGYGGAHERVRVDRGRPDNYSCVECGGRAEQWAYDHEDPQELAGSSKVDGPQLPYSLDVDHYRPMCATCHKLFDSRHRGAIHPGKA